MIQWSRSSYRLAFVVVVTWFTLLFLMREWLLATMGQPLVTTVTVLCIGLYTIAQVHAHAEIKKNEASRALTTTQAARIFLALLLGGAIIAIGGMLLILAGEHFVFLSFANLSASGPALVILGFASMWTALKYKISPPAFLSASRIAGGALLLAAIAIPGVLALEWQACSGGVPQYSLDQQITGCSALIGQLTNDADAYFNRGIAYDEKGQHDRAIADYTHTILIRPDDAKAYGRRGYARFNMGNIEGSVADYQQALNLDPGNKTYITSLRAAQSATAKANMRFMPRPRQ